MSNLTLPPGGRAVVLLREHGHLLNDIYVACGWSSNRLKNRITPTRHSHKYPSLLDAAHAIGTPEQAAKYRWDFVIGLSVILWAETSVQASILLQDVAPVILAANPLLLQLWRVYAGPHQTIEFLKLSTNYKVHHGC